MKVYSTLSRRLEEFKPLKKGRVRMYVCGVTPYDYSHLGHLRPAVFFDVVRRYFKHLGYSVTYVVNFTDVDDKIIARAREKNQNPLTYALPFILDYYRCLSLLGVEPADYFPKVTAHIPTIITFIQRILKMGYAYEANGDVYFSVKRFKSYGKLSGRSVEDLVSTGRIEASPLKKDPLDFALWKSAKPGEPSWDSPWGKGRPGWHIECSAMSIQYLGDTFDIHGGGSDLIFPHHENEIAQSRAATGKRIFAKYWMHNGMVTLKEEKMAKSTGKFIPMKDLLNQYSPDALRFFLLSVHYRSPVEYSEEVMGAHMSRVERFNSFFHRTREVLQDSLEQRRENLPPMDEKLRSWTEEFHQAMQDDFNTPKAIAVLHSLLDAGNFLLEQNRTPVDLNQIYLTLLHLGNLLGVFQEEQANLYGGAAPKSAENLLKKYEEAMKEILNFREYLRQNHQYELADNLRKRLSEQGWIIEDTPEGPRFRPSG